MLPGRSALSSRSSPEASPPSTRAPQPDGDDTGVARARCAAAGQAAPALDARLRGLRPRVLDHDDLRRAATAAAQVHRFRVADRAGDRRGGILRADPLACRRALERLVPHAARAPPAVHARRSRADGVLPAADPVHADALDHGPARARVLLRLLPLRAALPRALPRRAAALDVRPRAGR